MASTEGQLALRDRIVSEAEGLTDAEDLALRSDGLDFSEGVGWGLAGRLAELRGVSVEAAYGILAGRA
jgi:hypothetical protein